jgi:hypothetical protein
MDGRKLPGYGQAATFNTDWKYFRIYYQEVLGDKMDKEMEKSLRRVCYYRTCDDVILD